MGAAGLNCNRRQAGSGVLGLLAALLGGCGTMGPPSVQRDRASFSEVLAATWKEQTLLNIVKLRYADAPVYLDVSSIISSSSLESQVNLGAGWSSANGNNQSLGAYGRYTDRPTISYAPIGGEKFARYLLRPIPPASVFALIQAGYPVDRVLQLTTRSINGVFNRSASAGRMREADPAFYRLLEAMRRVQVSEAIDTRIERRGAEETALLIFGTDMSDEVARDLLAVRQILRLRPGVAELSLTFGGVPRRDTEIAMLTRSMSEIFLELAATIEAPPEHMADGRALPAVALPAQPSRWDQPLVRILSGAEQPEVTYAAVRYRDHWFWIDDRDLRSKSTFTFVLILFSLAETGVTPQAPVITVPAN